MTRNCARRGISLVEVLCCMLPALLILGLLLGLLSHSRNQDAFNSERLDGLASVLAALARVRADVASGQSAAIRPDGGRLELAAVEGATAAAPVVYELSGPAVRRNGAPLPGVRVERGTFAWAPGAPSVLLIDLAARGDDRRPGRETRVEAVGAIYLPDHAARAAFPSWAEE